MCSSFCHPPLMVRSGTWRTAATSWMIFPSPSSPSFQRKSLIISSVIYPQPSTSPKFKLPKKSFRGLNICPQTNFSFCFVPYDLVACHSWLVSQHALDLYAFMSWLTFFFFFLDHGARSLKFKICCHLHRSETFTDYFTFLSLNFLNCIMGIIKSI